MKKNNTHISGFSLVEVVFALGVATFCLLPIFALLPIGVTTNQDTVRETAAASLALALSEDLRATPTTATTSPYYNLSVPATGGNAVTNTIYLTGDAVKIAAPSTTQPTYLATVVCTPAATGTLNASTARILVTWRALANQANGTVPTQYQGSFQTVVGLDRN